MRPHEATLRPHDANLRPHEATLRRSHGVKLAGQYSSHFLV